VRKGWARAAAPDYTREEAEAKRERLGIWAGAANAPAGRTP
jgi:endonuclease YncB( thermonuclease family)